MAISPGKYAKAALLALVVLTGVEGARAESPEVKIVGLGATSCARFSKDLAASSGAEREYFAWAQGFMSAILLSRPAGVDERMDLSPVAMPLSSQVAFLKKQCDESPDRSFSEAVEILYRHLRVIDKAQQPSTR